MNHKEMVEKFPRGTEVEFTPKSWCGGAKLTGIVTSHIYSECMFITAKDGSKWFVSAGRCEVLNQSNKDALFNFVI